MKYELTNITTSHDGVTLYRIRALRNLQPSSASTVRTGDLGGFVRCMENLSQDGDCWVHGNTWVYGDARVYGNAKVAGNARVYGNARVFGNAKVYGNARVFGNAKVYGNARVFEHQNICYGRWDSLSSIESQVAAQCNLKVVNGFVLAYKVVRKLSEGIYSSLHDSEFRYVKGKIAKVTNPDMSSSSCTTGLHFGALDYWIDAMYSDCVQIACWIKVSDIITVQEGKIRASRCKVIGD